MFTRNCWMQPYVSSLHDEKTFITGHKVEINSILLVKKMYNKCVLEKLEKKNRSKTGNLEPVLFDPLWEIRFLHFVYALLSITLTPIFNSNQTLAP